MLLRVSVKGCVRPFILPSASFHPSLFICLSVPCNFQTMKNATSHVLKGMKFSENQKNQEQSSFENNTGPSNRWTDGQTDGQMDGRRDRRTDGWMDTTSKRSVVAIKKLVIKRCLFMKRRMAAVGHFGLKQSDIGTSNHILGYE